MENALLYIAGGLMMGLGALVPQSASVSWVAASWKALHVSPN